MKATRWRDRRRIAQAVREGKRLDNPREAGLAVGMAEQQRLFNRSLRGAPKVRLIVGVVLVPLGLLAGAVTVVILGVIILLIALAERGHEGRLLRRLERAEQVNREQASLEVNQRGH